MSRVRATGPSIVRIGVEPERYRALRQSERDQILYHLDRVLGGEASAVTEWERAALKIDVVPWKSKMKS